MEDTKSYLQAFAKLNTAMREKSPLVHNITNYVTVNDVANATLAIGASPIMADAIEEAANIASISSALVINIGTLNARTVESMIAAGRAANEKNIPIVFDPVGAGASAFRNKTTERLLQELKISILRGNLSEISFIAGVSASTKGVDVSEGDSANDAQAICQKVAKERNCSVVVTGKTDFVSDGLRLAKVDNGVALLSKVTGTGCMTSAITGAYAGASDDMFVAALAGVSSMGIAGEIAFEKSADKGTGSFRVSLIDALSQLQAETILKRAKIR